MCFMVMVHKCDKRYIQVYQYIGLRTIDVKFRCEVYHPGYLPRQLSALAIDTPGEGFPPGNCNLLTQLVCPRVQVAVVITQ